jgi:hypothetical protein
MSHLTQFEQTSPNGASPHASPQQCANAFNQACPRCQRIFQIQRKIYWRDFFYTMYALLFKAFRVFSIRSKWMMRSVSPELDPKIRSNMHVHLVYITKLANLFQTNPDLPGLREAFDSHHNRKEPCEETHFSCVMNMHDNSYHGINLETIVHDAFENAQTFHFACANFPVHVDGFLEVIENLPPNLKMYFDLDEIRRQVRRVHEMVANCTQSIPSGFTNCDPNASIDDLNVIINREMMSRWNFISGECISSSRDLMRLIKSQFLMAFTCLDMKIWNEHYFSLD